MKYPKLLTSILLLCALASVSLTGCAGTSASIAAVNNSPTTATVLADLKTAGQVLAVAEPQYANLAAAAVDGLTILQNGTNPTALSGTNIASDALLIANAVNAVAPGSKALGVTAKITQAYTAQMSAPGVTPTPATANAVLANISTALYSGVAKVPAANAAS